MSAHITRGMTLIELILTVAVIAILAAVALPAMSSGFAKQRLKNAAEKFYSDVQWTRSEAIQNRYNISLNVIRNGSGTTWCYGILRNSTAACDCTVANSCDRVVNQDNFENVAMSSKTFNKLVFDGTRPMLNNNGDLTGSITFTNDGNSITADVTTLGRPGLCSSQVGGYSAC